MGSRLAGLLGGSPIAVLAKLVFLSLVVGVVMHGLGLTPETLVGNALAAARRLFGLGLDTFRDAGGFILTGAVIVIPIWLLSRLLGARR